MIFRANDRGIQLCCQSQPADGLGLGAALGRSLPALESTSRSGPSKRLTKVPDSGCRACRAPLGRLAYRRAAPGRIGKGFAGDNRQLGPEVLVESSPGLTPMHGAAAHLAACRICGTATTPIFAKPRRLPRRSTAKCRKPSDIVLQIENCRSCMGKRLCHNMLWF